MCHFGLVQCRKRCQGGRQVAVDVVLGPGVLSKCVTSVSSNVGRGVKGSRQVAVGVAVGSKVLVA